AKKNHGILEGARCVFIKPPTRETLETRLRKRGTAEEDVQQKLAQANIELKYADIPGFFDKIIVSDNLDKAYEEPAAFTYGL
ncbi:hypothetical protein FQN49_008130, partial [Arthroderma sp. PD_2]